MSSEIERKRILVLTSTFPRWESDHEPRFVEYLCRELAHTHSISVLAPHYEGAKLFEQIGVGDNRVDIYRFRYFTPALQKLAYNGGILANIRGNFFKVFLVPFFLVAQLLNISVLHRKIGFDVVHAHWIIPQGLVAALFVGLWPKAPSLLVTAHGGDLFALQGRVFAAIKRWILKKSNRVTVVSNAMKITCEELGVATDKILVRSMGVDLTSGFTPGAASSDRKNLIFVGRLVEKKGVRYLLLAMESLAKKHPRVELTIVGDGPDRAELESLARDLRIENQVAFVGTRMNTELPALLRSAKIAVMPSIVARSGDQEGLGLVAIEAMGCGCAVVATNLAAVRDSVQHGETGLIAIAGDAKDLADKIDALLCDDALANSIAENGRNFALQNFDWRTVGETYSRLLAES